MSDPINQEIRSSEAYNYLPVGLVGLSLAAVLVVRSYYPVSRWLPSPYHLIVGWGLIGVGFLLFAWALKALRSRQTTAEPIGIPTTLVTEGPYRFSRNPIYLGDVCLILGLGFLFSSPVALLAALVFFVAVNVLIIPLEELNLTRQFGGSYDDYRRAVRRWI